MNDYAKSHEQYYDECLQTLNNAIEAYRLKRKNEGKSILANLMLVCGFALSALLSYVLDDVWLAWLLHVAIIGIVVCCCNRLNILNISKIIKKSNLTHEACIAMEILIRIKEKPYQFTHIQVYRGRHVKLYKKFIQLYPELESKELKMLTHIKIKTDYMCQISYIKEILQYSLQRQHEIQQSQNIFRY